MDPRQIMALVHVHTRASDGRGTPEEIARDARAAGVEAVVLTDHDRLSPGAGRTHGVLMIPGQEVTPRHNHMLVLGLDHALKKLRGDGVNGDPAGSQELAAAEGGVSFIAHPLDGGISLSLSTRSFAHLDFSALEADGLEIWNCLSALKRGMAGPLVGLGRILFPKHFLAGPHPLVLSLWDTLGRRRRVAAIGGADAHALASKRWWLPIAVYSYRRHMDLIHTGLWLEEPLSADDQTATAQVIEALALGRSFAALGPSRGFTCRLLENSGPGALPGSETEYRPGQKIVASLPRAGRVRLVMNGRPSPWRRAGADMGLAWRVARPGVYRVEAQELRRPAGWRPWIFANPFYLRESPS